MLEGHLTSEDAAKYLGIDRQSLYNAARDYKDFPKPIKVGRTPLYPITGLDEWRARHPPRPRKRKRAKS